MHSIAPCLSSRTSPVPRSGITFPMIICIVCNAAATLITPMLRAAMCRTAQQGCRRHDTRFGNKSNNWKNETGQVKCNVSVLCHQSYQGHLKYDTRFGNKVNNWNNETDRVKCNVSVLCHQAYQGYLKYDTRFGNKANKQNNTRQIGLNVMLVYCVISHIRDIRDI